MMHAMCPGCAFRPGTDAYEGLTRIKATLCVQTGEPFYCHANLLATGGTDLEPIPGEPMSLCRGFVDALVARLACGEEEPEWRRRIYTALTDAMVEIETSPLLDNDPEAQQALLNRRVAEAIE